MYMHSICTCSYYAQTIQVSWPPIGVMGAKRESFTRKVEKKKKKTKCYYSTFPAILASSGAREWCFSAPGAWFSHSVSPKQCFPMDLVCQTHQKVHAPIREQLWKFTRPLSHRAQGWNNPCGGDPSCIQAVLRFDILRIVAMLDIDMSQVMCDLLCLVWFKEACLEWHLHSQGTFSGPPAINSMAKKGAKKAAAAAPKAMKAMKAKKA